jgi:uncharacterized protein YqeY
MEAPLRVRLNDALKKAMKGQDKRATSTLRLILAAVKDRDIAHRGKGKPEGLTDEEILGVLQTMIRQRHESIELYRKGGREELAEEEEQEIKIIETFLPRQMSEEEMIAAVREVVAETGAASIKDMGKAMAALRERYAGRMDFAKASAAVRAQLS